MSAGAGHGGTPGEAGIELRDAFNMRFFPVERGIRGVIVLIAAYGVWRLAHTRGRIQQIYGHEPPLVFRVRGGKAAHEAHLGSVSLPEVEEATHEPVPRHPQALTAE